MNVQEVIIKLLMEQPFYGYVASSVSFIETDQIETIKMASIPNLCIQYNPIWYQGLTDEEKIGVILHELLHVILLHQHRRAGREINLWSVACDMAVNEMLPKHYLLQTGVTLDRIEKKLKRNMERGKNAEYYYSVIADVDDLPGFTGIEGDQILIYDGNASMKVSKLSQDTASDMELNALKSELFQLMEEAKVEKEYADGFGENVEAVYQDLQMDWRVILKRFLTGRGKMITRKTYKRQSRRQEEFPGTKRSIGVNALIAIDESGSISDTLVKSFYHELTEINKITGANLVVTRFDTVCTKPVPLGTFIAEQRREKRGGTDFRPVFQLADERKIPLIILFTDGDGEAPSSVNQNTLWVLTKGAKKPADFGFCVHFER